MFFTGKSGRKSGLRITQCVCACAAMLSVPSLQAQTIISELLYDAASTDNGNVYRSVVLAGVIPADGVFLIGDDSGDGSTLISDADLVLEIDFQNGPDSVVLRNGATVLDALGYGDFTGQVFAGEGNAAPDAPSGSSLARHNPLLDTNNNFNDFMVLDLTTPGAVPVSAVPVPPAVALFLSGIIGLVGVARKRS